MLILGSCLGSPSQRSSQGTQSRATNKSTKRESCARRACGLHAISQSRINHGQVGNSFRWINSQKQTPSSAKLGWLRTVLLESFADLGVFSIRAGGFQPDPRRRRGTPPALVTPRASPGRWWLRSCPTKRKESGKPRDGKSLHAINFAAAERRAKVEFESRDIYF